MTNAEHKRNLATAEALHIRGRFNLTPMQLDQTVKQVEDTMKHYETALRLLYLDSSIVTKEAKRICDGIVTRFGQFLSMEQAEDVKDKIRAEDAAKFDMIRERDDYLKNLLGNSYYKD